MSSRDKGNGNESDTDSTVTQDSIKNQSPYSSQPSSSSENPSKPTNSSDNPSQPSKSSQNPLQSSDPTDKPVTKRTLHVYGDGLTHKHLIIKDSDKSTPLYTVACERFDGHQRGRVEIFRPLPLIDDSAKSTCPAGSFVGNIAYDLQENYIGRWVRLSVNNRSFGMLTIGSAGYWEYHFSLSGWGPVVWQYELISRLGPVPTSRPALYCWSQRTEDCWKGKAKWLAKFELKTSARHKTYNKVGTLKLAYLTEPAMMDELVSSGMAMMELHRGAMDFFEIDIDHRGRDYLFDGDGMFWGDRNTIVDRLNHFERLR